MVGWILPDVIAKDTLMSKKIGFGKGQDFLIFGSTAGLRLTCISQHRTSLKIIQDCQINLTLFAGKIQQMFHSLQGLTSNISPFIFWITTLSPGNKGASLTACHSSPCTKTRPSLFCHCLISPTLPNMLGTPQADFLFRSLTSQKKGKTTCSINSKRTNPITSVNIMVSIWFRVE
jgi:hypothetical protein